MTTARSSRASSSWPLIVILSMATTSAHRRDEYLQAARVGIDPQRVELELELTAGSDVADAVVGSIDRNRNGSMSDDEQRHYSQGVLKALTLTLDGTPLRMQLEAAAFPDRNAMRRGEGTIRLRLSAGLPPLADGRHHLLFRNRHDPKRSVYLANALVPRDGRITITAQRRDRAQRELTIDYVLRAK